MEKFREISSVKRKFFNFDFERSTSNDFAELQKNSDELWFLVYSFRYKDREKYSFSCDLCSNKGV